MGLENRIPCKKCGCEIYKDEMKSKENGEYSCCVWYMDNCILEGIPVGSGVNEILESKGQYGSFEFEDEYED